MGDGDALAIGGNHFIHAARRNIDLTAIVMNNRIYGMTGGQYSPLSGLGTMATTAPYANIDYDFDTDFDHCPHCLRRCRCRLRALHRAR